MRLSSLFAILIIFSSTAACNRQHSSAGFRLPSDGDAARGKVAFVAHKCHTCHRVSGTDLPLPTVRPAIPVELGTESERKLTDGYLVASIIAPSEKLANYPTDTIAFRGHTRMPEYVDTLSVRELTDIVSFLQQERRAK